MAARAQATRQGVWPHVVPEPKEPYAAARVMATGHVAIGVGLGSLVPESARMAFAIRPAADAAAEGGCRIMRIRALPRGPW